MKKPSLIVDYSKLSDAKLAFMAQNVNNALSNNPDFPETVPTSADLMILKDLFEDHMGKAANGDRIAIAAKNQVRNTLLEALRTLALDVEAQANGDHAKLVSTGFTLAADGEVVPPLSTPEDFKISDGLNPGELRFSSKRVPQAVSYLHQYIENEVTESSQWISKPSTSREHTFTGLRSGVRIYGRTIAIGRKGQEATSVVLSRVVQ